MTVDAIKNAYRAEDLVGSPFTDPLRSYQAWYGRQVQLRTRMRLYSGPAWTILVKVIANIFAYTVLGPLALIGTALNLTQISDRRPQPQAVVEEKVSPKTEQFLQELKSKLLSLRDVDLGIEHCSGCYVDYLGSGDIYPITMGVDERPKHTYYYHQKLSFTLQVIFDARDPDRKTLQEVEWSNIQSTIQKLSSQHDWIPQFHVVQKAQGAIAATVIVLVPDQVPLPVVTKS